MCGEGAGQVHAMPYGHPGLRPLRPPRLLDPLTHHPTPPLLVPRSPGLW